MKNTIKLLILSLMSTLFIVGCSTERSREEKVSAIINKIDSPFLIISTTPQNLMDKSGVMDGVLPYTYELILGFFIDEAVTGIDYSVKTQLIVGKGESYLPNTYGVFKIKDEAKFKELIEKEANAKIEEKDGMRYAIKKSDGYCVTWNEEFAIIANIPVDLVAMFSGSGGDQGMKMVNKSIELIKSADAEEPIEEFTTFLASSSDVAIHYDGDSFFAYMEEMSLEEDVEIEEMKELYKGMSYDLFLDFNDGSIDLKMASHLSDEMKEDLAFIGETGVDNKLLAFGKSQNPILYGSYSVGIEGLLDYMKEMMPEREYERMEEDLSEMGLEMDDAKKALSGEILYIVDSFNQVEETYDFGYGDPYTYTKTEPVFGIVVGVSDKSVIEKLFAMPNMDLASVSSQMEEGIMDEIPEFYENGVVKMGDAYLYLKEDVLFMSNDKEWADQIAGNQGMAIDDKKDVTSKNPFGIYVDFEAISKMDNLKDAEPFVNLFVEFFGSTSLQEGEFSLVLKDNSKNSLRIITEVVAEMMNEFEKAGQEMLEEELNEAIEGFDDLEENLDEIEENIENVLNELELN